VSDFKLPPFSYEVQKPKYHFAVVAWDGSYNYYH